MQYKECVLKNYNQGDSWDNNSVHTVPCNVGQMFSLRALRAAQFRIHLTEYNGAVGYARSSDNWNVEGVRIDAYDQRARLSTCILNVGGDPLVRLKADANEAVLSNYPSHC